MKRHNIQQDIQDILMEEIPNDMNILPDIHKQLKKTPVSPMHSMYSFTRIAAIIAIFLLVSAGGYALFQRNLVSKDIPQQRITDINETKTIEDVDVTLNWAYADAHRLALAYSMEYPDLDNFVNMPIVTLATTDGLELNQDFGGGGGGGGGGSSPLSFSETIINYDTSTIEGSPDNIDLILTLDFSAEAVMSNPSMMPMSGGGGGSMPSISGTTNEALPPVSGGGGGGSTPTEYTTPDVSNLIDRVYTFEFTLPFYAALEVEPVENTVESNGVTITINNIRYTPSLTKFDMCYTMPNDEQWGANIQIMTDSEDSPFYSRQQRPIDISDDDRPCFEVSATAAIPEDAAEFVIEVLYLTQSIMPLSDELARAEEDYFAQLGYNIEIDADPYGYSMKVLDYPANMDEFDAEGFVRANLFFKRYEGDWSFVVPLN